MSSPFNKRDLYRFLTKKVDAETHARIAAEVADPTSELGQAYAQLRTKLLRPFQVNWPLLLDDAIEATGTQLAQDNNDDSPTEDALGTYLDMDLPDLMGEFELAEPTAAFRGPADHPLLPFLPLLKDFVRRVWNWPDRRQRSEYQDAARVAKDLAEAIQDAQLNIPFSTTLIAVTLLKTGLDRLCQE